MIIGIVGKTNVGKSTFFKAATLAEVLIANYPFATIKPSRGIGYVRVDCAEKFFNVKCNPREGFCIKGQRFVPINLLDVAGLVPGASKGRGLGNQFLDDLSAADILIHVVDMAGRTDSEGKPCSGHDPALDIKFLEEELDYWYLDILKKVWKALSRRLEIEQLEFARGIAKQFSGLKVNEEMVKKSLINMDVNLEKEIPSQWTEQKIFEFARELRRLSKPIIIAANKSDRPEFKENFNRIKQQFPDTLIIPCSAESELALRGATRDNIIEYISGDQDFKILRSNLIEKKKNALKFIKEKILCEWKSTGVQDVLNKAVFDFLKYIYVFPGGVNKLSDSKGNILPDCYLLPPNSTALDFAYRIHSDFGDNFIKAINVKKKMPVGKDSLLKKGDVIEIMTS